MKKILLIAALGLPLVATQAQEKNEKATAYMVADAHLDTQWNWDVVTTIDEYVKSTLYQNLFLMNKYPNYVFNFEGGIKYYWMKEYYPEKYEELKQRIKEGRWHICGSSWDATDAVVPSTESAIRNIMLGQVFYRNEFGSEGTDIFLPDCFGFPYTLPTVAKHCGLIAFSSQKLDWRNNPFYGKEKKPYTIGVWKGIDGSDVMFAHGYGYGEKYKDQDLSESQQLQDLAKKSPLNTVYRYYGTGDTGGSPNLESVRSVERGLKGNGPVKVISATSDQLFKDYQPADKHAKLPVFDGELLMDVHGTGCYTSQAAMKLYNRQNEKLGDAAERSAVVAEWLGTVDYPGEDLSDAWKRFIYHQFHDDLTGTSIPRAYEYSWNDELISLKQFSDVLTTSVSGVASQMNTKVGGTPVVVYNPNGVHVNGILKIKAEPGKTYSVYDQKGRKVKSQMVTDTEGNPSVIAMASVPANAYAVFEVKMSKGKVKPLAKSVTSLENSVYKLTFDANGDLSSIYDKKNRKELVAEGKSVRLAMFTENKSYAWPAWEILKETLDKEPVSITEDVKITLVEDGALRKSVCVEKKFGESVFRQYVRLHEGVNADRIDFDNEVFWQSTNALLKAEFPMAFSNPEATYDLGVGSIKRGNNTLTAYEIYAHEWADLTASDGSYGVSVMNDCKYGWDKPSDNTIRLTLLHTPETRGGYSYQNRQDFGYHEFSYALIGHKGDVDKAEISETAAVYNRPLMAFASDKHVGTLGREFSFASSDNKNVAIKAIKKAEVSDEYVVRVYETSGKAQKANIKFAGNITRASLADGTEQSIGSASFNGNTLQVDITPFSVRTYKVTLPGKTCPGKAVYEYASLPYDKKCFSWNEFRGEANFGDGYSYPAELLPESELISAGVPFKLGEKEINNGMSCKGQTLDIPAGCNRVYLLAASSEYDCTAEFAIGTSTQKAEVPYFSDFIGQWGHTGHTRGFLKKADIAHVCTHRHSSSGDATYEFAYMFRIALDVPKDATSITFPDMPNVVVFAATFANETHANVVPACDLFKTAFKEEVTEEVVRTNLLKDAKLIGFSAAIHDKEKAEMAFDGNLDTKWCDVKSAPSFLVFDLGAAKKISGWKMVNGGKESASYVTSDCFLQGRNSETEEWKTFDKVVGNRSNVISRTASGEFRYLRLLITRPEQGANGRDTRIYEVEVYE